MVAQKSEFKPIERIAWIFWIDKNKKTVWCERMVGWLQILDPSDPEYFCWVPAYFEFGEAHPINLNGSDVGIVFDRYPNKDDVKYVIERGESTIVNRFEFSYDEKQN